MNADQRLLAMSFVVSATAYLLGCVACAIAWHDRPAAIVSLLGLGANTFSYVCQFYGWRLTALPFSVGSWIFGAAAMFNLVVVIA